MADELATALDVSMQATIHYLLKDLQERMGLSHLFISHDITVIEHMSNRIGVPTNRHLVEVCETDRMLEDPQHEETRALVKSAGARERPAQ